MTEQNPYPTLAEAFALYEQDHPKPVSVTPQIPQGQQLGTIDKLAQSVVPKLVDKLNAANWEIEKLKAVCEYLHNENLQLYRLYNETLSPWLHQQDDRLKALEAAKPVKQTRTRKKKVVEPEVDITEIADYNPDTDTWEAMTIDGKQITGSLIDTVTHLGPAATQMYSEELVDFINKLDEPVKAAIAKRFPTGG